MKYIALYTDNPTAGGTDGTVISENGAQTSPLSVTLDASKNETKTVKCAIRCATGYETTGTTVIGFSGDTKDKWLVSEYEATDFEEVLTIKSAITAVNKVFYVKVSSSIEEEPTNDKSVSITVSASIKATE